MTFDNVTAMSIGGHSVSSVWLKGVRVWPTIITYYVPFRLVRNGSYMTWAQFQAETWNVISIDTADWNSQIDFNQNQVEHLTDGNGHTVFYLSTTNPAFSSGAYVYLTTDRWEFSMGMVESGPDAGNANTTPTTTSNTLSAFNAVGITDIVGLDMEPPVEEDVSLSVCCYGNSLTVTSVPSQYSGYAAVVWEIYYQNGNSTLTIDTEYGNYLVQPMSGTTLNGFWAGGMGGNISLPQELWGTTITLNYSIGMRFSNDYDTAYYGGTGNYVEKSYYGSFQYNVPYPTEQGQVDIITPPAVTLGYY